MKTCPKCKTTGIPDDAKFCPMCGHMFQEQEKTTRIIFIKEEMSAFRAFNTLFKLRLVLNDKCVAFIPMKPYFQKEIVVKKGDIVKLEQVPNSGEPNDYDDLQTFSIIITDDILSESKYYLKYVNHILADDELAFYPAL